MGGQRHAPAVLPAGKTRYPLFRGLGGPQRWSGRARKISPLPGFDPWTVQPVASLFTDWDIPARFKYENKPELYVKVPLAPRSEHIPSRMHKVDIVSNLCNVKLWRGHVTIVAMDSQRNVRLLLLSA